MSWGFFLHPPRSEVRHVRRASLDASHTRCDSGACAVVHCAVVQLCIVHCAVVHCALCSARCAVLIQCAQNTEQQWNPFQRIFQSMGAGLSIVCTLCILFVCISSLRGAREWSASQAKYNSVTAGPSFHSKPSRKLEQTHGAWGWAHSWKPTKTHQIVRFQIVWKPTIAKTQKPGPEFHIRMQGGPFVQDIRMIMRCIISGCTVWGEDDIMISGCKGSPLVHYIYMKMTLGASYHDISGCKGVLYCTICH